MLRGYLGTSLREVAERAGVGERTLYDSFGGKCGMLRRTLEILTMSDGERRPAPGRAVVVAARSVEDRSAEPSGAMDTSGMMGRWCT